MQTNMNIEVPKDFAAMCIHAQKDPEQVLQAVANQMSYPLFFTTKNRNKKLATYFFIDYIQSSECKGQVNESLEEHYFGQMANAINESYDQYPDDQEKALAAAQVVMEQWARAAIAERARYLTDGL